MATFTVHVPRGATDPVARAVDTVFVRDGFSVAAFLFGPLYLLRHRAWLGALAWIVLVAAGSVLCAVLRLPASASLALLLLAMLFTGLEASSIRRFALNRRGCPVARVVTARTREEGERAFFREEAAPAAFPPASASARPVHRAPSGVIGLFPGEGM